MSSKLEKRTSLAIAANLMIPPFNYFFNNFSLIHLGGSSYSGLLFGLLIVANIYCLSTSYANKLIPNKYTLISIILFLLSLFSYIIYMGSIGSKLIASDYNPVYSELLSLWLFSLPCFLLSSTIVEWKYVLKYLNIASPFVITLGFYCFYKTGFSVHGAESMNYMVLSYDVLLSGFVCLSSFFRSHKLYNLPFAIIALFIIVAAGCRGAIICYILFVLVLLLFNLKKKTGSLSKYLSIFIIIIFTFLIFSNVATIGVVESFFDKMDISSRIINTATDNTFFESSSRDLIKKSIMEGLSIWPWGYGLFGDRYITYLYYGQPEYAHSIIYETIANFGIVITPLLWIWIVYYFVKLFKKVQANDFGYLFLVVFVFSFKLFFSSSYLNEVSFWIVLGMLISFNSKNSKNNIKSRII